MSDQLPALIVLAPMFGALIVGLAGIADRRAAFPIVFATLLVTLCATVLVLAKVITSGPIEYFMAGWDVDPEAGRPRGAGIELRIDTMNGIVLVVIAIVSLLVSIFSIRRVSEESTDKTPQFYTLFLLLITGLLGQTATADAFNLFVLIEVTSLTSYALIAMGSSPRGTVGAFNYVIMGTVGASFYLLGVGYLYMQTGTLNMMGIREAIADPAIGESKSIMVAFILMTVGLWVKLAFFPLHGWLPNAYSYCPSTTSCILAPLVTKVSIYVMLRVQLGIFGADWVFSQVIISDAIIWLAVIAIIAGSFFALAQAELKKMLCYLIVAEVGYMVGGAWLGTHSGTVGTIYHIVSDAFMTLCLFIAAGIFFKHLNASRIEDLEGLFKKTPITMGGFLVGAFAMIGIPPTCGFFSKWYLVRGGIESGHWEYVIALLISSLVNAVLFFRIIEVAYFGRKPAESHGHDDHDDHHEEPMKIQEASWRALIPLYAAAICILLVGIFNGQIVEWIEMSINDLPVVGLKGGAN